MGESVLLLDDDADLRESLCEVLLATGAGGCVVVGSLDELRRREEEALLTQLAILDVHLGDGCPSGLDVHRWLRERGYRGRIVFLTGHAMSDPRVLAALSAQDTQLLLKPIEIATLEELVNAA